MHNETVDTVQQVHYNLPYGESAANCSPLDKFMLLVSDIVNVSAKISPDVYVYSINDQMPVIFNDTIITRGFGVLGFWGFEWV